MSLCHQKAGTPKEGQCQIDVFFFFFFFFFFFLNLFLRHGAANRLARLGLGFGLVDGLHGLGDGVVSRCTLGGWV